jgi:hypothetical protein
MAVTGPLNTKQDLHRRLPQAIQRATSRQPPQRAERAGDAIIVVTRAVLQHTGGDVAMEVTNI